ncbi:MAG: universal stress protein [Melioribacteraceae bacterium]|nr:universal stress protein [Melioribacteraceae bacterium]
MTDIKKILVPIDFSDYSISALKYAINFAKKFNAEILLTYVVEPFIYAADFTMSQAAIPDVDTDTRERAYNELKRLIAAEIHEELPSEIIIRTGKPFFEINEVASEKNVDLIIIATHGHTGVEHLLFGSTAEKVVRKAPCPVLTLREPIKGFKYKN